MNFLFFLFFKLIDSSSGQRYPDIDTSDTIKLASFTHKFLNVPIHTVQEPNLFGLAFNIQS